MALDRFSMKILTLGDGNLSFSLTLSKKLVELEDSIDWTLIATSFDSQEKLYEKYPEAKHVIQEFSTNRLRSHSSARFLVDAMHLTNYFPDNQFDQIIFNFPHLGFEDLIRHQAFLSHLFVSCKKVLSSTGYVHIALAESQEFGWKLMEAATLQGFVLTDKILLEESKWPGYYFRRHQTGKSFRQRVGSCYHYSFRPAASASTDGVAQQTEMQTDSSDTAINLLRYLDSETVQRLLAPTMDKSTSIESKQKIFKTKKGRMHKLTEGRYQQINSSDSTTAVYECLECHKTFPSEQGVCTHVYAIHILVTASAAKQTRSNATEDADINNEISPPKKRQQLYSIQETASASGAAISTASDVRQTSSTSSSAPTQMVISDEPQSQDFLTNDVNHHSAVHNINDHPEIQANTVDQEENEIDNEEDANEENLAAEGTQKTNTIAGEFGMCEICGWCFQSPQAQEEHHTLFAPRDLVYDIPCGLCDKKFASERSVTQHRLMSHS